MSHHAVMVSVVRTNLGRDTTAITEWQIENWLNERHKMAATRYPWPQLEVEYTFDTATDTRDYDLSSIFAHATWPSRINQSLWLHLEQADGTYTDVVLREQQAMRLHYGQETENTDEPRFYALVLHELAEEVGGIQQDQNEPRIELYPTPDNTYTMRGKVRLWPDEIWGDATEFGLAKYYPRVLTHGATADGFAFLSLPERSTFWELRAERELELAMRAEDRKRRERHRALIPRFGVPVTGITRYK